jgi:hypothetical protein
MDLAKEQGSTVNPGAAAGKFATPASVLAAC